jgi:hypothetical protein
MAWRGVALGCAFACAFACAVAGVPQSVQAQDKDPRPAAGLQDNSFLIEEAYNQEPWTVQHIVSMRKHGREWDMMFTQEWGLFSQAHQFSYSIPYSRVLTPATRGPSRPTTGFGDVNLNYRYQLLTETDMLPAIAPRITLIVPSGDERRGLGDGSTGTQFNLPISKIIGDRFTVHANVGHTRLFDVDGLETKSYHAGGSLIYAHTRNLNFMFEFLREWNQEVDAGALVRANSYTVSPGVRYALDVTIEGFGVGQLVFGFGVPMVFTSGEKTNYGAIFYASFEHAFRRKNRLDLEVRPNSDQRR